MTLNQPLLLQILVRLAVVHVALLVLQLFHGLLLEDLIATFALQLLSDWVRILSPHIQAMGIRGTHEQVRLQSE